MSTKQHGQYLADWLLGWGETRSKNKRTQIQPIMFITFWFAGSWLESIPSEKCKGPTR
jgi:hypothetical protein